MSSSTAPTGTTGPRRGWRPPKQLGFEEPDWGVWATPEPSRRLLPEDMTGLDAIELGCGQIRAPGPGPKIKFVVTVDCAHRFPSEQVWKLRKR